jgi:uncharacterized protein (TIGR00369 family)
MPADDEADNIPAGYTPLLQTSPLVQPWEPLYSKHAERALQVAVRIREAHCNRRGFAHGGLIAALADMAMGHSLTVAAKADIAAGNPHAPPTNAVTISLTLDFLASVQIGEWLEIKPRVLKLGRNVAFVDCVVEVSGKPVARANATFRTG